MRAAKTRRSGECGLGSERRQWRCCLGHFGPASAVGGFLVRPAAIGMVVLRQDCGAAGHGAPSPTLPAGRRSIAALAQQCSRLRVCGHRVCSGTPALG